jgi:hypothetical protein
LKSWWRAVTFSPTSAWTGAVKPLAASARKAGLRAPHRGAHLLSVPPRSPPIGLLPSGGLQALVAVWLQPTAIQSLLPGVISYRIAPQTTEPGEGNPIIALLARYSGTVCLLCQRDRPQHAGNAAELRWHDISLQALAREMRSLEDKTPTELAAEYGERRMGDIS